MGRAKYIKLEHVYAVLGIIDKLNFQGFLDDLRGTIRRLDIIARIAAIDEWKRYILSDQFYFNS